MKPQAFTDSEKAKLRRLCGEFAERWIQAIETLEWAVESKDRQIQELVDRLEDRREAHDQLRRMVQDVSLPALRVACNYVLDHPRFSTHCGSTDKHHSYPGGLVVHTCEVASYALHMAQMFPDADQDAVLTAAIFHDFMKVEDYGKLPREPGFFNTSYRDLVRHVAGSHAEFMRLIHGCDVPAITVLKIEHAILAHHGRKEWGSPIEPQTLEAHILHYADMLSVKYGPGRGRR
jgi:3'-5' exoribonuclease